ncbi:hypothetical protein DMP17_41000 [Pseudonocardia sp. TMWB2A]
MKVPIRTPSAPYAAEVRVSRECGPGIGPSVWTCVVTWNVVGAMSNSGGMTDPVTSRSNWDGSRRGRACVVSGSAARYSAWR